MEIKLNLADGIVVFSALLLAGTSLFLLSRLDYGQNRSKTDKNKKNSSNQMKQNKKSEKNQKESGSSKTSAPTSSSIKNDKSNDIQYRGYKTNSDGKIRYLSH